ncbi:hypothetical protein [Fundicoccus ignavus]|uniref:Uncharacterized protein n=1 Tax=Fundicoccus ignavus TaxID=2664442 RepID=A0A6I2GB11_9LACT|nr:hypothetical protein [Fundicoccus ignavus]MRI84396.1 hypothetical protein [Fundicoccus ignavus]MRJ47388.1 hypothetical protein [Fundicoccus ignavus]
MLQKYEQLDIELKSLLKKRLTAADHLLEKYRNYEFALDQFHKEKKDVARLEKQSLSTFVQNILGTYDEKLEKEKKEEVNAKVELDRAATLLESAHELLDILDEEVFRREEELNLLREDLMQSNPSFREQVTKQEKEKLELEQEEKEINEAIEAGERVLDEINGVLKELDSANSMATWDMFTDSFFIDLMKYDKIDKAEKELAYLERALERYQKELKDVDLETSLAYEELSQMSRAFDIFFDNIFSDWNTRDTIRRNIAMLEDMNNEVDDVQNILRKRKSETIKKIQLLG